MIPIGLKLLSNEVIAEICCRLKFSPAMASRFVETDEEFIEELRNRSENKNTKKSTDYWTKIFQQWEKMRGKNEELESYEVPVCRDQQSPQGGKQVIAGALGQLPVRINFLVFSKFSKFENTRGINP